jgi:hypothetical protein
MALESPSVSVFELPFKLDISKVVDNQPKTMPFSFPLAPFDSGSWSIVYSCKTTGNERTLTCSITWRGCQPSVAAMSARLFNHTEMVDEAAGPSSATYGPSAQLHAKNLRYSWIIG